MTIGWHRLARPCPVENMLNWWYHRFNRFISRNVCKYFCPMDTSKLMWPLRGLNKEFTKTCSKRSLLQRGTAAVERNLDKQGDKEWKTTSILKSTISCYFFLKETHQPWRWKVEKLLIKKTSLQLFYTIVVFDVLTFSYYWHFIF